MSIKIFHGKNEKKFSIKKEILWSSDNVSDDEVTEKETEYILKYESNNPEKGYNQRLPKIYKK
jgi:hypothetical protein